MCVCVCVCVWRLICLQKSVVIITQLPFVTFFKRVAEVVGTMFFEAGSTVFEVAHLNASSWCVPVCPVAPTVIFRAVYATNARFSGFGFWHDVSQAPASSWCDIGTAAAGPSVELVRPMDGASLPYPKPSQGTATKSCSTC